ncbi:hypothetical protein BpHYR1_036527 [Brachionus plicatilis]|uniref:Uncharacterized protein n=1 Tax=Brachionus plicatilis TaxID=10195 RepID=A0A3M7QLA1_BRAPC|nr:hypothetical protein BpHYR1_036527 [Brachionus plicatilis]
MSRNEIWISFDWISSANHGFKVQLNLDTCHDFDDLKTQLMHKLHHHDLHKYGILINCDLVGENDRLGDILKDNSQKNPIIFVKISKNRDFLQVNEEEHFLVAKNRKYLWCSLDGYIPIKLSTYNCQKLEDLKSKLCCKLRKCKRKNHTCWQNGHELPLDTNLDEIKYNSFENPIVFCKKTNESKNFFENFANFFKF